VRDAQAEVAKAQAVLAASVAEGDVDAITLAQIRLVAGQQRLSRAELRLAIAAAAEAAVVAR
jgi:hypothetical protein